MAKLYKQDLKMNVGVGVVADFVFTSLLSEGLSSSACFFGGGANSTCNVANVVDYCCSYSNAEVRVARSVFTHC